MPTPSEGVQHCLPAQRNLQALAQNPYPGRGIAIGLSPCGQWAVQAYWIMGRSSNSQNRRFVFKNGVLRTEPVDMGKVEDPSLIIYPAMQRVAGWLLATNGTHTTTLARALDTSTNIPLAALQGLCYEPDAPHYTPRIAGGIHLSQQSGWLALVKASVPWKAAFAPARQHALHGYEHLPLGAAWYISTYARDGNPLPSFSGEPLLLPIKSHQAQGVAGHLWKHLSPATRVSLAVRCVHVTNGQEELALCQQHPLE